MMGHATPPGMIAMTETKIHRTMCMEITANAKESPLVFPDASLMMLVITTLTQPTMMARATTQGILAMMGTAQQPMTHTTPTAIASEIHQLILGVL